MELLGPFIIHLVIVKHNILRISSLSYNRKNRFLNSGRGVGGFAGGILMSNYGSRSTFHMFGSAALILGIFYFFIHRFYLIKMEQNRLRRKSGK